jgi:serine/threonine-protein kinase
LHQKANQVEKAIATQDEAIAECENLARTTDAPEYRTLLIENYAYKSILSLQADRPDLAAEAYRKANTLNPTNWWVKHAERLIQLDGRLSAIRVGKAQAADTHERLALAQHCQDFKHLYADAARFYTAAFSDNPKLAEDLEALRRYNAACAAALAGCGQGKDGGKLDDKERARWRKQALAWLAADLALWKKQAEKGTVQARAAVQKTLRHWRNDTDLAGLRNKEALAKLPADEQKACTQLWADVATLLKKAEASAPKAGER